MKRFRVTVNDSVYDVEVEELQDGESVAAESVSSQAARSRTSVETMQGDAKSTVPGPAPSDGTLVKAPLAGTILSVRVSVGSKVKRGDVLVTLEALKMENEIQAPVDGTVSHVGVAQGQSVEIGALLVVIK